jgi:hypothetical protein
MGSRRSPLDGLEPSHPNISRDDSKKAFDAIKELEGIQAFHRWDPNLPQEKLDAIEEAVETGDQQKAAELERHMAQDSQYDSVRAAVRNTDGEEVANTVRAWVLGMFFTTLGSGLNMLLSMRWASASTGR